MIDHGGMPFGDTVLLARSRIRDFVRPLRHGGPLWADLNVRRGAADMGQMRGITCTTGCDIFN